MTHGTPEPNEGTQHATGRHQKPPRAGRERGAIDVATVSAGKFWPGPQAVYQRWAPFTAWYAANAETILAAEATRYRADELGAPVPEPRQVFAIGMNYRAHAAGRPWRARVRSGRVRQVRVVDNRSRGGGRAAFRGKALMTRPSWWS